MASTLVLLHSPLLGPGVWRALSEELEGRDVVVPAWPKLDDLGAEPYADLVSAMAAKLSTAGAAVLVAHSGAGALLPALASGLPVRPAGVIFCDAILPHPGRSWFDTAPRELSAQLRAGAVAGELPSWDRWWPPGALERLLPEADQRARLLDELDPIPLAYFEAPAPEAVLEAPAAYLQLSGAYAEEARLAGRRGWPVVSLPLHHLAMLTHPKAVAGSILSLAERLEDRHG